MLSLPRLARNSIISLLDQQMRAASDQTGQALHKSRRLHALPGAMAQIWRARADIACFVLTGDQPIAAKLRRQFGLAPPGDMACAVPPNLFDPPPRSGNYPHCTIVIPVFNAFEDTQNLLNHLPGTISPKTEVVLVDDGSDDPRLPPVLNRFQGQHANSQIIRHMTNLGFVAAVNSGISAAESNHHIILLNTDTLLPDGWVDRLMDPIARDTTVASVTPLSNNAEILSVPFPGIETAPTHQMVNDIDRVAATLTHRNIEVPTGVGFCMGLNRTFLSQIGLFDPVFGRGYGEEVDWCLRARAAGGRHVVQSNLFVGHRGGASFGADEKAKRIQAASRLIANRYPDYDRDVRTWVRTAPIAPEQLAAALAWLHAVSETAVTVFLGHSLGGGAETALQAEIKDHLTKAPGVLVLRVGGPRLWRLELHGAGFKLAGDIATDALLHQLLSAVPRRRMIYSCGVGATDPGLVPHALLKLATDGIELRLHDFLPISPSWNLLDSRGRFNGIPPKNTKDRAHHLRGIRGRGTITHSAYRALWGKVVDTSDRIVAFAPSGKALLSAAYPNATPKICVQPHCLPALPDPLGFEGRSVGILGGINLAKGGAVLQNLSRMTNRRLVVIGEMDGQFHLPTPNIVHGRYAQDQIGSLARQYDIGLWLIPSVCPETFSFATHEALATGLPVLSFNLGAQADALQAAPNGHVLDIDVDDTAALANMIEETWPATRLCA